jgi:hypothetical protein
MLHNLNFNYLKKMKTNIQKALKYNFLMSMCAQKEKKNQCILMKQANTASVFYKRDVNFLFCFFNDQFHFLLILFVLCLLLQIRKQNEEKKRQITNLFYFFEIYSIVCVLLNFFLISTMIHN